MSESIAIGIVEAVFLLIGIVIFGVMLLGLIRAIFGPIFVGALKLYWTLTKQDQSDLII